MNRFKSLIYLLIFLLIFQSGCSAVGYGIGRQMDHRRAKPSRIIKVENVLEGDHIEITLNDGKKVRGKVQFNDINQTIGIKRNVPDPGGDNYIYLKIYEWAVISEVSVMQDDDRMRIIVASLGLIVDLFIIYYVPQGLGGFAAPTG